MFWELVKTIGVIVKQMVEPSVSVGSLQRLNCHWGFEAAG
jgi:hypothetical protein